MGGPYAAGPFENCEVLVAGVGDQRSGTGEHRRERSDVDGHRVEDRETARPRDLHQGQPGVIRALALELGVEPVERYVTQRANDVPELGRFLDELDVGHGRSLPDTGRVVRPMQG